MWRWILALLALLAGLWLGNLAMFNWWAAGGPPTVNRAAYESRGNIFFALALVAVALSVALVVQAIRRRRAREARWTPKH